MPYTEKFTSMQHKDDLSQSHKYLQFNLYITYHYPLVKYKYNHAHEICYSKHGMSRSSSVLTFYSKKYIEAMLIITCIHKLKSTHKSNQRMILFIILSQCHQKFHKGNLKSAIYNLTYQETPTSNALRPRR